MEQLSGLKRLEDMGGLQDDDRSFGLGRPNYEVFIDDDGVLQVLEQKVFFNSIQGKRLKMLSERILPDNSLAIGPLGTVEDEEKRNDDISVWEDAVDECSDDSADSVGSSCESEEVSSEEEEEEESELEEDSENTQEENELSQSTSLNSQTQSQESSHWFAKALTIVKGFFRPQSPPHDDYVVF